MGKALKGERQTTSTWLGAIKWCQMEEKSWDERELGEGKSGGSVGVVDLLDGVGVGSGTDVKTEVVLVSGADDSLSRTLHSVLESRVDDILLGGSSDLGGESSVWLDSGFFSDGLGERLLYGSCKIGIRIYDFSYSLSTITTTFTEKPIKLMGFSVNRQEREAGCVHSYLRNASEHFNGRVTLATT